MRTSPTVKRIFIWASILFYGSSLFAQQDSLRLSISKMFDLALENSREIKLSKAYLSRAKSVIEDKTNSKLPGANFTTSAGYLSDVGVLGLGTMPSGFYPMPHFSNSYALQASALLYAGGRQETDIDIAKLEANLAELNVRKNTQTVKLILVGYYLDLYQLYQQKMVYERNLSLSRELLGKINARYENGIALKSDRIRNELLVSSFELALSSLMDHIQITNNNIVSTLALPEHMVVIPEEVIEISEIDKKLVWDAQERKEGSVLTSNLENQEASLRIAVADEKLKLTRSANYPEISLFLSGAISRPYTFDIPAKDIYANTNAVGIKMNIPVSNFYLSRKKIDIASKEAGISRLSKELTEETVSRNVKNDYIKYREANSQLPTLYKQKELADENYRRITDNYMEQLALNTEVMDASNQKLEADLRISKAKVRIIYAYYQFLKTLGKL